MRDEILDRRRAAFGALAQANGAELRQRADRLRRRVAHQVHAGHERGGHGSHAHGEHSELSFGWCDGRRTAHSEYPPSLLRCSVSRMMAQARLAGRVAAAVVHCSQS